MCRRVYVVSLLLACAALRPTPASGDRGSLRYIDFGVQCTPAAFQACASVQAWNAPNEWGGTSLWVRVANMQGRSGFEDLPRAGLDTWFVSGLQFEDCVEDEPDPSGYPNRCDSLDGLEQMAADYGFSGVHEPALWWDQGTPAASSSRYLAYYRALYFRWNGAYVPPPDGEFDFSAGYMYGDDDGLYFWGCDGPSTPSNFIGFSMCEGDDGAGIFNINLGPANLRLSHQASLELRFVYDESQVQCSTSRQAESRCVKVPEPGTWLLLATGISFMGLFGWRRRRAKGAA